MSLVLPGVELVLARFFEFVKQLISELFPTLLLPTNATIGSGEDGRHEHDATLVTNFASLIIILIFPFSK